MRSMSESIDNNEKIENVKTPGIFRTSVIGILVLLFLGFFVYTKLFLDNHLTSVLRSSAEMLYGATVDVTKVSLSFKESKLNIGGISFADKENLEKDKISFNDLELNISIKNLLLKKLIIENIQVGSILFDTERATKGEIFNDSSSTKGVNPYIKRTLRKEEKQFLSFAKNLSPADKIDSVKERGKLIESKMNNLKAFDSSPIKEQTKNINELIKKVKKENNVLKQATMAKDISKKIKQLKKEVKSKKNYLTKEIKDIKKNISTLKVDSSSVITQSKNFIDTKNLKSMVKDFALKRINEEIAPITNLINEYESYLPKLKSKGKSNEESQGEKISDEIKRNGRTIKFQRVDDLPNLLLRKLEASSQIDDKKFNLLLSNVTNKFNKKIKKSVARIDFAKRGGEQISGNITFDPTTINAEFTSSNKTVFNKRIIKTNTLQMLIKSGIETWNFKFKKTTLNSEIIFAKNYSSTNISLSSPEAGSTVNEILGNASKKIKTVQFNFGYNEKTKNKFLIKSNLINDLPKAIESSGKSYLNSVVEKNKKAIKQQVTKEKKRLRSKIKKIEDEVLSKIKTKIPKFDLKKLTTKNKKKSIKKIKTKAKDELLKKIKIPKVKLPKF